MLHLIAERIVLVLQLTGDSGGETEAGDKCRKCSIIAKLGFLILETEYKFLATRERFDKFLANLIEFRIAFLHTEEPRIKSHQIVFHPHLLALRCTFVSGRGAAIRVVQQLQQPCLEAAELRTVTVTVMVDDRVLQGENFVG